MCQMSSEAIIKNLTNFDLAAHVLAYFKMAFADIHLICFSAVVDTTFVDIYVDTKNIPTCRYNIQHIDKRTMEK